MTKKRIIIQKSGERVLPFLWYNDTENFFDIEIVLREEGASVVIVGVFLGSGQHALVFNVKVIHEARNTKSKTFLRGVFSDKSSFSNDGLVVIRKGAIQADGYFSSKVLLFNDAKGRSVPSLEIDENDLKAGHASTIGRPDMEQLFYLRSRGISEEDAEKLIVSGFFDPLLSLLSKEKQKKVREKIFPENNYESL